MSDEDYRGAAELELPVAYFPTGAPAARTTADLTPEERDYNRRVFGQTYRERYGPPAGTCVSYCLNPGRLRRGARCPSCYGPVVIRAFSEDIAPGPTRAERLAAWIGGWAGAFLDAMMFPFRVGRDHTRALVRDLLQEAIEAGLRAEIAEVCPLCEARELEGERR
jgi:hypothetical protein